MNRIDRTAGKLPYVAPELEVIPFTAADIITTSMEDLYGDWYGMNGDAIESYYYFPQ